METETSRKKKVMSTFSRYNFRYHRLKLGHKIRDINKDLESINKEASGFGLQMRLASGAGSDSLAALETDSFTADPIFLGRVEDMSKIVKMLTTSPTDKLFSIVLIVGMGGLGKTTLARNVYSDDEIVSHFGNRIWVHVSEKFDPVILFRSILASLTTENVEVGSREVVLKKLQKSLGDKRYLLVLDNVWNDETEKWDNFMNSLEGISCVKGNAIIITTRSANVALIVKTLDVHQLEGLSEDDCWSIIKAKAFGEGDVPSEFENTGKSIAKRCQGLPLAASVIGGALRSKSKDEWLSIEKNWLSDFGGDGNIVPKILKLSFDHLSPPSLKKCFAYCSIFPKGVCINREELIELWMAEGFLLIDPRHDMESVGNKFFNLLVQNSLLLVAGKDGYDNITHCNTHDLVHDLASALLGSKANSRISDDIYQVRYIGYDSFMDESSHVQKEQARHLRTLFFKGKVSDTSFSDFKCLHVLTIMDDDVKELPGAIRNLIHLRFLDVSYSRIECLPDSIGELYHLQTLRAIKEDKREVNYMSKLPDSLVYLISLRHLHIPKYIELPPEMGRLTSLQTLPYFHVGDEAGRRIIELGSLKNLKGEVEIHNLEKVYGKEEAKSAKLFRKPNISNLKFVWNESREGETTDENVLEGLQPHQNLKSLEIGGFKGRSFPLWTEKMAVQDDFDGPWMELHNLMEIRLTNCKELDKIPMLGHLLHLKSLSLVGLTNVRSIDSSFYGIGKSRSSNDEACKKTIVVFPALERLELSDMPNFTEWVEVELQGGTQTQLCELVAFPRLEYLKIQHCRQLMSAPSHFPCLKELEICEMDSCLPLSNICGIKLTTLTNLIIKRLDGLVCLPDSLFQKNQNLSMLEIWDCHNLTHLVSCAQGGGASLRDLWIYNCSNLTELIPDNLQGLNSLEHLRIWFCPNLKSIPYPGEGQSGDLTSPYGPRNLLIASDLESNSAAEIGSLTELTINSVLESSTDYASFKESYDGIFQRLKSLSKLKIHGFGNLSSLKTLVLEKCKKLRHLPSKRAMQRLTKLTGLHIEDCPLLKERCIDRRSDYSEWHKISHIPFISVEGLPIPSNDQ